MAVPLQIVCRRHTHCTATGSSAMAVNLGNSNTATGSGSLSNYLLGSYNTASGFDSMFASTSGSYNTASGAGALGDNTTGTYNTAVGYYAGVRLTTGNNNIIVGNQGVAGDDHIIRMGDVQTKTFVAGISGVTPGGSAVNVVIDSNGQLGTVSSSRRFKEDITDMGDSSTGVLPLRPVTYRYKQPYADGSRPLDYGLIAEEVADVYPDLVVTGADGQIETVQYQKLTRCC
jgi:trimeric autotransporter adhesin